MAGKKAIALVGRSDAAERILRAAETLFSKQGFDGVSMHEIAERASVSKANIFHHFSSKNALYLAVLRNCCEQSSDLLEELVRGAEPLPQRLKRFAKAHLAMVLEQEQVSRLIQRELVKGSPRRGEELAKQIFGENFARFVDVLRQAQATGELRADIDPAMVAVLLIGADVFFFESHGILRHFKDVDFAHDPQRYSGMLVDILLNGIVASQ